MLARSCRSLKTANANITALTSTLDTFKNNYGSQTAKIASFEADKLSDITKIKSSDSSVIRLQKAIKENKNSQSVVVVDNSTAVDNTSKSEIVKSDTVNNFIYPTYKAKIEMGKWVTGFSESGRDSTHLDISIKNEYDVVLKKEKGTINAYVINHNPYTTTQMERAATVTTPPIKKWVIGPSAGVTYYQGSIKPYIGLGITYNLIRF